MRIPTWLQRVAPIGVPVDSLEPARNAAADAYALVDELPPGPAKAAAWKAFALQAYGDRLLRACERSGVADAETAAYAKTCFRLAGSCVAEARGGAPVAVERLPEWPWPVRSQAQLAGMRDTFDALRAHLGGGDERLAPLDDARESIDLLWIDRPPEAIRLRVGRTLEHALDGLFALGATFSRGAGG